jgi:16S rRNA processing protein RimM
LSDPQRWLRAGLIGRPHGLDGSFHVVEPVAHLLVAGTVVNVGGSDRRISRRAGSDARPIVRLEGCEDRAAAERLRGQELLLARASAPELDEDEWWVTDLEGCAVADAGTPVGVLARVLELPSCQVLEVQRDGQAPLLVPLISDAVRAVDIEAQRIDIDLRFLGEA